MSREHAVAVIADIIESEQRLAAANRIIAEQVRAFARVRQLALQIMRATADVRVLKLANQIVTDLEAPRRRFPALVAPDDDQNFVRTIAAVSDVMAEG